MSLKACPQCSAVYSQHEEVRCDCGYELPYNRKVQVPDNQKDIIILSLLIV